ncbi:50S ribosomal protein L25 [Mobilitalea sibirica]|uniref:Large ribosomal subunit protein bL25 n=1 Tax=Mobilitalea sibirica TaxID=1462919 RepID=A0A8J7HBF4_9FIRM|nr:50S ribosomal protein L25 [Mobilitalea sibirica]MBH1941795.1 50S ribosomal protein L25 [Mobilitalea sibirica]
MTEAATLKCEMRKNVTKAENKRLLREGYIIGVIFGKGLESNPVAVKKEDLRKTMKENGRNSVMKLKVSRKSYNVMIKNIQTTPLKYEYYHVDFQQVSLTETVKAEVPIKFLGLEYFENTRLILNRHMDSLLISGLPQDIPQAIECDISHANVGDTIHVSDLKLNSGITTEVDSTHVVATVSESKMKEETEEEETLVTSEIAMSISE